MQMQGRQEPCALVHLQETSHEVPFCASCSPDGLGRCWPRRVRLGMGGTEDGEALHSLAPALGFPDSPGTKWWLLRARGWHREARGAHLDISGSQWPSVLYLPPLPAPPCVQAAKKGSRQSRGIRGAEKPALGRDPRAVDHTLDTLPPQSLEDEEEEEGEGTQEGLRGRRSSGC